jgi:hypothetical protein
MVEVVVVVIAAEPLALLPARIRTLVELGKVVPTSPVAAVVARLLWVKRLQVVRQMLVMVGLVTHFQRLTQT